MPAAVHPVINRCTRILRHRLRPRYLHSGVSAATRVFLNWIFSIPTSPVYASAAGKNRRRAYEHEKEKSKKGLAITNVRLISCTTGLSSPPQCLTETRSCNRWHISRRPAFPGKVLFNFRKTCRSVKILSGHKNRKGLIPGPGACPGAALLLKSGHSPKGSYFPDGFRCRDLSSSTM